ncbi:MAG: Shikimate dehydrogenase [Pseudomonadota bacterium]|jgi:shikimate dehydrogenase
MQLEISARSSLCLVIGDPIGHSLSPAMHNAAYAATHLPFVMGGAHVRAENLRAAIEGMRALDIRGLAVTMPHKVAIMDLLDEIDPVADAIGAVNTVVNNEGKLIGFNTDWLGILRPLEKRTSLKGKKVALLGAGGAAQAALYACTTQGASVTIFNRSLDRAESIAERFGATVRSIEKAEELSSFDIIINTTSVGMAPEVDASPVPESALAKDQLVFETIYAPITTKLLSISARIGAKVIPGLEMFLEQGMAQFNLHTGVKAPREEMEKILRNSLGA